MKRTVLILIAALSTVLGTLSLNERARAMSSDSSGFPPEVVARIDEARVKREAVRRQDPQFFEAVSRVMFERDPMGINFGSNPDEYEAEAGTVIPRLGSCASVEDVVTVLHEEFASWFGASTAGPRDLYVELARDIWSLHKQRRPNKPLEPTR